MHWLIYFATIATVIHLAVIIRVESKSSDQHWAGFLMTSIVSGVFIWLIWAMAGVLAYLVFAVVRAVFGF